MGSNGGSGQPMWWKCPKCQAQPFYDGGKATGRTRPLPSSQRGKGGARVLMFQVEYVCRCEHVGWSRHSDAGQLLKKLEKTCD